MACTPPITTSLGYVFLDYRTNGFAIPHRARLRLSYPVAPDDTTTIEPAANTWALDMAACLPSTSAIHGWGTMTADGAVFYLAAFSTPYLGTHATATGALPLRSRTVTITGKGYPVAAGQCAGQTRTVLYVTEAFEFAAGAKTLATGSDPALETLRDFLTGNSILGADFYGNVGNWRTTAHVQHNAYTQRRLGT